MGAPVGPLVPQPTNPSGRQGVLKLSVEQRLLGPRAFFASVIGILLIHILALDMYAPALPTMQDAFGVTELYLNRTMFSFLFVSTIAMMLAGPISDRFGRKPVLLAGCLLFTAGSLVCATSPSVDVLVVARAIEALGMGASSTLAGAIVKDAYKGDDLKLAMTLLQSLIIIGPVVAPFLGSFAISMVGWRGVFWGLTVGGAITVVLSCLIGETYDAAANEGKNLRASLATMLRDSKMLVSDKSFASLALFIGVTGVPFFAFIAVSPYILLDDFQVSYLGYSLVYAGACATNFVAPFVYMRLSHRWDTPKIMRFVIALVLASSVLLAAFGSLHPVLLLLAFMPYALAEGIARPAAYMVLLDQPPDVVGTASAFGNFTYGVVTAFATVAATFPWPSFMFGLVVLTACSGVIAAALYAIGHRGW